MGSRDLLDIMRIAISIIEEWWEPLHIFVWFIGLVLCGGSLISLFTRQRGGVSLGNFGSTATTFLIGTFLLSLDSLIEIASVSFFASQPDAFLSYSPPGDEVVRTHVRFAVVCIGALGFLGFVRSLLLFKALADPNSGQASMSGAIMHFVGGLFCMNFVTLMRFIGNTFSGTPIQATINRLFG